MGDRRRRTRADSSVSRGRPTLSTAARQDKPRVSYVVPAYNYGHFVGVAIDSLLRQSFESLEVIVIDDCSTDDTAEVLQQYRSEPRVRLVRHERNLGHIATYNEGLRMARGEFVGLLSADDVCLRLDAVERMVAIFDADPGVGFVYSALCHVDSAGVPVDAISRWPTDGARDGLVEFRDLVFTNFVPASGTLVRTSCHQVVGDYDPRLRHAGDWDLWLRLAARYRVGYVADSLFGWRLHARNMHDVDVVADQADAEHAITLRKAFASLPAYTPRSIRSLRGAALRLVSVRTVDLRRRSGRLGSAWRRATSIAIRDPRVVADPAYIGAVAKLAVVSLLGRESGATLKNWRRERRQAAEPAVSPRP